MLDEDQRQSAALKVNVSNYVGTAALAVLAGAVAIFTFIQQSLHPSALFYVPMVLGILVLVVSIFLGGKGAGKIARTVGEHAWTDTIGKRIFDWQSLLALAGLCLVLIATALGVFTSSGTPSLDSCTKVIALDLSERHPNIDDLRHDLAVCEAGRS